jgi:tetratricopeptide (TPR) repeat protein
LARGGPNSAGGNTVNTMDTADVTLHTTLLASRAEALQWMQETEDLNRQAQFVRCLPLTERVIAWARHNSDLELLGRGLLMRGTVHYTQDRSLEAAPDLQEAVRLCKAHAAPEHEAQALRMSAALAHRCSDPIRSIALSRAALACLPQLPELTQRRQDILLMLSLTLQELGGEYVEATHCCREALALVEGDPAAPPLALFRARARLAFVNAMHAEALAGLGRQAEARRLLDAAAAAAPALTDLNASIPPLRRALVFIWMLPVLALLGRRTEARHAAALALSLSRRTTVGPVRNNVLQALALMHRMQGDFTQSLRHEVRLLDFLNAHGYSTTEISRCQQRMARLHALQGQHEEALRIFGIHRQQRSQHELTERLLRCRVAAVERQAERRRQQALEIQAHGARLAVIGRLIAHTHHALNSPLSLVHQCLAAPPGNPQELQQRMVEVNRCIDRAAALVTQLKLFSYRAVPQQMALSLHDALRETQQGLLAQGHGTELVVSFAGDAQLLAWADSQRLGILLKVLLLELMQRYGSARVQADVQVLDGQIALSVHAQASQQAPVLLPTPPAGPQAPSSLSLGLSLCSEIALEMGGSFQVHDGSEQASDGLVCCLRLPGAPGPARPAAASAVQAATS